MTSIPMDPSAPTEDRIRSSRYKPPTFIEGPVAGPPVVNSLALASEGSKSTLKAVQEDIAEIKVSPQIIMR